MRSWKCVLTSAVLVVLGHEIAAAQWRQVATMPTSRSIWGIDFVAPDLGFVAAESHELYRTTDGGQSWTKLTVPGGADEPLYNVFMLDASVGFCTSNSTGFTQGVYRTLDGGATWQPTTFPLGGSWYHIDFVSPTVGFAGCNGGCVKTTDQGATWLLQSGYPDCPIMYGMDFRDANVGLAGGTLPSTWEDGIFKTIDGGQTWVLKHAPSANAVVWLDDHTALADEGIHIVRSTDDGETWVRTPASLQSGISDLARVDAQTVVGVSSNGTIWYSHDRGTSWSKRVDGIGSLPGDWSVSFRDATHGWVAGTDGIMYKTSDGGITWTYATRGLGANWYALAAWNDRSVVAGGFQAYVSATADGGATWRAQIAGSPPTFGRDTKINDLQVLDWRTIVAAGDGGSFLKSTDRGQTWRELGYPRLPVDYFINGLEFTDELNGWIVGFDLETGPKGYVRRTHDGGQTWEIAEPNVPSLAVEFVGERGWILTTGEPLWRTQDGGQSWAYVNLPDLDGNRPSPAAMSWPSAGVGYVCGWYGYLARSANGGKTWTHLNPHLDDWVNLDVTAPTNAEVWVVSSHHTTLNNRVMRSLDGGATWQTWKLGNGKPVPTRVVRTATKCYVACFDGEVFVLDGLPELPLPMGRLPQRQ